MMKLYEIADQYTNALENVEDSDSFELMADTLDSINSLLDDKLDSIGKLRRNYLAEAEALKNEAKFLKEKADKAEKNAEKLEKYVAFTLKKNGFAKADTGLFKFSFRKSTSLVVSDIENFPAHFLKPQPPKPDIAGLKSFIKKTYDDKGVKVPEDLTEDLGVRFETKESLQIK